MEGREKRSRMLAEVRATPSLEEAFNHWTHMPPWEPVLLAITEGNHVLLDALLTRGACVTCPDRGDTEQPLWLLATRGMAHLQLMRLHLIRLMLSLGATPLLRDARGVLLADVLWTGVQCTSERECRHLGYLAHSQLDMEMTRAMLLHHTRTTWTRRTHATYPRAFRERVFAFLCVTRRLRVLSRDTFNEVVRHLCVADGVGTELGEKHTLGVYRKRELDATSALRCGVEFPLANKQGMSERLRDIFCQQVQYRPPANSYLTCARQDTGGVMDVSAFCIPLTGTFVILGRGNGQRRTSLVSLSSTECVQFVDLSCVPGMSEADCSQVSRMHAIMYYAAGDWRMEVRGRRSVARRLEMRGFATNNEIMADTPPGFRTHYRVLQATTVNHPSLALQDIGLFMWIQTK
jgi:hypothetical protein